MDPRITSVRNSGDLTTVGAVRLKKEKFEAPDLPSIDVDYDSLSKTIQSYSTGHLSSSEFKDYLDQHKIPITPNLGKHMRTQDQTSSVPFHTLGKEIYTALRYI